MFYDTGLFYFESKIQRAQGIDINVLTATIVSNIDQSGLIHLFVLLILYELLCKLTLEHMSFHLFFLKKYMLPAYVCVCLYKCM